jgi:hypothetical protein
MEVGSYAHDIDVSVLLFVDFVSMQLEHFNVLAMLDARSESYSSQITQKDFFHR